jgi:hypothetical protein
LGEKGRVLRAPRAVVTARRHRPSLLVALNHALTAHAVARLMREEASGVVQAKRASDPWYLIPLLAL